MKERLGALIAYEHPVRSIVVNVETGEGVIMWRDGTQTAFTQAQRKRAVAKDGRGLKRPKKPVARRAGNHKQRNKLAGG